MNEVCLKKPKARCFFFAPVKDGLNDYILPVINQVFEDCPDDLMPVYNTAKFSLTYKNGSSILFRGSNMKQHRLRRGNDVDLAGIDEGRDVDELESLVESVVMPSLFSSDGRLIITTTPADTMEHQLYGYRQRAELEGWLKKFTIWDAHRLDPEAFPESRIKEFREECLNETFWRREYECEWVRDEDKAIIPGWNSATMVVPPLIIQVQKNTPEFRFYRYFEAVDFGIRDFTVCLVGFYHYKDATLYIEKELVMNGPDMTTTKFGDSLVRLEKDLALTDKNVYMRVSDSDPGSLLLANDLVQSHRIAFYPTDKERLHAMANKANILVASGRVKVSSECKFLIGSLTNCQWDDDRLSFRRTALYGHADAVAALIYLVRNLVESNPIPSGFDRQRFVPDSDRVKIPWATPYQPDKNKALIEDALGFNKLKRQRRFPDTN